MRSKLAVLAALALVGTGLLVPTAAGAAIAGEPTIAPGVLERAAPEELLPDAPPQAAADEPAPTAYEALSTADRVVQGRARADDPSATIAMRDLWLARPTLGGAARDRADALLARPTDGTSDPNGMGYTAPSTATCGPRVCLHYVTATTDAAPSLAWVDSTLATMETTWTGIVDTLGYRAPVSDGTRGGNAKFDVYLADLGGGFYGYCAPESRSRGRTASGYCVLDNDFNPQQFPSGTPEGNRAVTAAHEFFHSVQYAYDYGEDRWMMESTATWMEERITSAIDDNRQYLPYGQLYSPVVPLDHYSQTTYHHYGNWIFWEYLSTKYGVKFVRKAWEKAGSLRSDGRKYSIQALKRLLKRKGGFTKVYSGFVAGNVVPARTYPEGGAYDRPRVARTKVLTGKRRGVALKGRLQHLSSATARFKPGRGLGSHRWRLKVRVNGPRKATSPAARVLVQLKNGKLKRKTVRLNRRGDGGVKVPFSAKRVRWVSVSVINASTRYRCHRRTWLACNGLPRDDKARFVFSARATR